MRNVNKAWLVLAALLLAASTQAQALQSAVQDSASKEFSNAGSADDGFMDFGVIVSKPGAGKFPDVHTKKHGNSVDVDPLDAADFLAAASANAICNEAVDTSYICTGSDGGICNASAAPGNKDCCDGPDPNNMNVTCNITTGTSLGGFTLLRTANAARFEVVPIFGNRLNALNDNNTSGSVVGTDMLPRFCLRVDRGSSAVNGTVNFSVRHFHGTGPVATDAFSVNTTGLDDVALHQAIVDALTSLNLGLELGVMDSPGMKCEFDAAFSGPLVTIWNVAGAGVLEIGIDGLPGQNIVAETNGIGEEGQIPTLSEWGLVLLAGILTVSALWMLRRRGQTGSPA